MSIQINLTLDNLSLKMFDIIVEKEYSDRSKLMRKWIKENFKEEYEEGDTL